MRFATLFVSASLVLLTPLTVLTLPAVSARLDRPIHRAADDYAITNAWVQTETVARLMQSPNSSLTYVALNLVRVKDDKSLQQVFATATKGGVDPVLDRQSTVAAIKAGDILFRGGTDTGAIDVLANIATDLESGIPAAGAKQMFSPESQAAALSGALSKMPPELQTKAMRELAVLEGLDYDKMRQRVTANNFLRGSPSESDGERNDSDKALDQSLFDRQIDGISSSLSLQQQALNEIEKQGATSKQLAAKQEAIATQTEHLKAGVYLAGVILGPVVGQDAANKITTAGDALVKMQDAVAKFGPGAIHPDSLLLCTNFVSAGLVVAQLFMQKDDPANSTQF